jgi:dolichyl-phosphate-mannose-protein mannosyltransferase
MAGHSLSARAQPAPPAKRASVFSSARATFAQLRAALIAGDPQALVPTLCLIAIALGVYWRFVGLAYPPTFTFDEHHFVENARNYLRGAADWNDHPPLGKLLMLPGLILLGDNGLGWRIHAALLGTLHLGLIGAVAAKLFRDHRAGWLAAALVAIDGLFVAYSRTALLDIPMNAFMMAALAMMLHGRRLTWFAGAAVALGLAVAVKWIAVALALVVPVLLVRQRGSWRAALHAVWMGVIAVLVYFGVVAIALRLTHQPVTPAGMVRTSLSLLKHHAGFNEWFNPADSRWFTWPWLWKPIMFFRANFAGNRVSVTSCVGNPLLWYLTTASFLVTGVLVLRALVAHARNRTPLSAMVRIQALILFAAIALLAQWILTNRESYLWHYMGTYGLGLVLLAGWLAGWSRSHPRAVGAGVLVVLAVSVFYVPVWTNVLLDVSAMRWRLFMPLWR